jgi:hypothetical protein
MLLALAIVRWYDLRKAYRSMYRITGSARITHRAASVVCGVLVLIPMLQLHARIAQEIFSRTPDHLAPHEAFGAPQLACIVYVHVPTPSLRETGSR